MLRIRVDDFPHTRGEARHSLSAFREFHRELGVLTGGKRYLLGVIPNRCTPDDILMLRNETDCVVGMHGVDHDEALLDVHRNEFPAYMTRQGVRDRLAVARDALSAGVGRAVRVYMPPRNCIDRRTADALSGLFDWYTTGPETDRDVMSSFPNNIHSQVPYEYGRSDELLASEAHLRIMERVDRGESVVLTLHWTWETNIGLTNLKSFLSQIPARYFQHFDE